MVIAMPHQPLAEPSAAPAAEPGAEAGVLAHDFNNLFGALILNLESLEPLLEPGSEAAELAAACLDVAAHGGELARRLFAVAARLRHDAKA